MFSSYFWFVSMVCDEEGGRVDSDEKRGSNFSHLSFVTTVSGFVNRVQKQTFSPCQRSLLYPRRREICGAAAAG